MTKFLAPAWPAAIPRVFRPVATLKHDIDPVRFLDQLALGHARQQRLEQERMGGLTTTWTETFFTNRADFTAFSTSSSEGSLLAGLNEQPAIPALYFGPNSFGRALSFLARGVLSTTGTPTIIFQWRLGTTSGSSFLSGTSVGVSAAITTQSAVSNQLWESRIDLICNTPGIGSGNTTLNCAGYVVSPIGFASPFWYPLEPSTPPTATWTATIDASATQYVNLSVTWSASSSSDTITCKQLFGFGLN